ncbi:helix-turn-helix domain-containing protein [Limnospira platensis]|uniref:helix-turn-helix domain-containing protein n=1 Tax=Limnospira platensis TaxID=118562 RepID=UPI003EB7DC3C
MYKAYKYRIYPTDDQKASLAKAFGCCRWYGNRHPLAKGIPFLTLATDPGYIHEIILCCRWYWNLALNLCQETYLKTGK